MPYLTAGPQPAKVASWTKTVWLQLQILSGEIRYAKLDQDIKNGGGFIIRAASEPNYEAIADANYEGYWIGDLWISSGATTSAQFHYEGHQITTQ